MKKLFITLSVLTVFIVGLWVFAIPGHMIVASIDNALARDDIILRTEGFKKGLFYNFTADRLLLKENKSDEQGDTLLVIENIRGSLNFLSLLKLDPAADFRATMSGGSLRGSVKLLNRDSISVAGQAIEAHSIPVLTSYGFGGEGKLSFSMLLDNGAGEARFSVDPVKLDNFLTGNVYLPLQKFKSVKGSMTMLGQRVEIKSIIAEGDGITARVKGFASGPDLDLNIELMIDSSFESARLIEAMLASFEVSPGYYNIKLKYKIPGIS